MQPRVLVPPTSPRVTKSSRIARRLAAIVAGVFGATAGAYHLYYGTLQVPGALATIGAFIAAAVFPVSPWRWSFLATLGVPGAYALAELFEVSTTVPTVRTADAALAFGGPFAAAYLAFGLVHLVFGSVRELNLSNSRWKKWWR